MRGREEALRELGLPNLPPSELEEWFANNAVKSDKAIDNEMFTQRMVEVLTPFFQQTKPETVNEHEGKIND